MSPQSQAEAVARSHVEGSDEAEKITKNDNNNDVDVREATTNEAPVVPQESALKRLSQRLRFGGARRALSAPPGSSRRGGRNNKPGKMLEEHYRVDQQHQNQDHQNHEQNTNSTSTVILPGLPKQDDNWSRDLHDVFNLVALVPVVATNIMNWDWDMLLHKYDQMDQLSDAWTGEYFHTMFYVCSGYFIADLTWMVVAPHCVRSPMVIVQHHIATLLYLMIPYQVHSVRWLMGACMSVEVNTWLLIARRVFNKQGFPPWTIIDLSFLSIRIKLISIFFYITWISIRCILYPYLLIPIWYLYKERAVEFDSNWNLLLVCFPLHSVFCALNLKWSYDLFMSKMRYWRRPAGAAIGGDDAKDKGL